MRGTHATHCPRITFCSQVSVSAHGVKPLEFNAALKLIVFFLYSPFSVRRFTSFSTRPRRLAKEASSPSLNSVCLTA